jgi:hypothetical protein
MAILLSVLRFTASDYHFGINKPFLPTTYEKVCNTSLTDMTYEKVCNTSLTDMTYEKVCNTSLTDIRQVSTQGLATIFFNSSATLKKKHKGGISKDKFSYNTFQNSFVLVS